MATNLGARASNAPPPVSVPWRYRSTDVGAAGWPGPENFIQPGGANAETVTFSRPERFWLKVGASIIVAVVQPSVWVRYDYKLSLLINYAAYGNDLNGIPYFRKANSFQYNPSDPWFGVSVEGLFYCEANTGYVVRLLTAYNSGTCQSFQGRTHWNMWAYTVGEGAY